jgi:protein TonB
MDDVKSSTRLRIALSLSVALLFHTFIGIFLARWTTLEPPKTTETLSVTLRTPGSFDSKQRNPGASPNQQSQSASITDAKNMISTTNQSTHSTRQNNQPLFDARPPQPSFNAPATAKGNDIQSADSKNTVTKPVKRPTFTTVGDRPAPSSRSGDAFERFNQLFAQRDDIAQQTPQISTIEEGKVDPYLLKLTQRLSQAQFYDNQFEYSKLTSARSLVIEIQLLASGAIENARILKPSGEDKLDKAAMRSAFLASPYPPPPIEDMYKGYTYQLELLYAPSLDKARK